LDAGLNPLEAIHQPRLHHQLIPNELVVEETFESDIVDAWRSKGHNVTFGAIFSGVTVAYRKADGLLQTSGDRRKDGAGLAF
jgi:gamma-glutamyltranspeptidase